MESVFHDCTAGLLPESNHMANYKLAENCAEVLMNIQWLLIVCHRPPGAES